MSEAFNPQSVGATAARAIEAAAPAVLEALKTKPWHQSLTVQGGMVSAAAGFVVGYGPDILAAFNTPGPLSAEIIKAVAGLLGLVAGGMVIIGRWRAGGLH
jgi:hypothetical protein